MRKTEVFSLWPRHIGSEILSRPEPGSALGAMFGIEETHG